MKFIIYSLMFLLLVFSANAITVDSNIVAIRDDLSRDSTGNTILYSVAGSLNDEVSTSSGTFEYDKRVDFAFIQSDAYLVLQTSLPNETVLIYYEENDRVTADSNFNNTKLNVINVTVPTANENYILRIRPSDFQYGDIYVQEVGSIYVDFVNPANIGEVYVKQGHSVTAKNVIGDVVTLYLERAVVMLNLGKIVLGLALLLMLFLFFKLIIGVIFKILGFGEDFRKDRERYLYK